MSNPDRDLVAEFRSSLHAGGRFAATVESYGRDAEAFLRYLSELSIPIERVEPQTLVWYRDHLSHEFQDAENSVRRKIIGIRQFYRFLVSAGIIFDSPFDSVPIPARDDTLEFNLSPNLLEEILLIVSGSSLKMQRDQAILKLLAFEGIKANELIQLNWGDFITGKNTSHLQIAGTRARRIQLLHETSAALLSYKESIKKELGEYPLPNTYIFIAFKGRDGSLILPKMTRHGLKFLLSEIGEKLKISGLHTECLRHYAIQFQLNLGKSPESIMDHMGLKQLGNIAKHQARKRIPYES